METLFLMALLLGAESSGVARHFRPAEKSVVPAILIEELCPDPEGKACWQAFKETGDIWVGDVNDDGVEELLLFPGSSYSGTGGQSLFLYQKRQGKWVSLMEEEGWLIRGRRLDILPIVREGYHDLRLGVDFCLQWSGKQYVAYEPSDYRQLSPDFFPAPDVHEAVIFWRIRYDGLRVVRFEPQWISDVPSWSVNAELDDPLLGLRWVAMFKGGVYGVQDHRSFLLLPQPAYLGAAKLQFDGDWLLIYNEEESPQVLARYNRRTGELRIEGGE